MANHPAFSDVEHDIHHARGVLGGDAFDDQERVVEKANPNGVGFDCQVKCTHCGKGCVVTLFWPELIVAAEGVLPADMHSSIPWTAHQGYMYPPVRCGCGTPVSVPISPDKAGRFLLTGVKMGALTQQQWDQGRQRVAQQAPRR